ncbi:MAG: Hsp20 family protein [Rhodospirillaceae bacterium]|jgi:molecular chaperone IbpA|nr:Hsp20 family protein [Rhodospirillaceae bacterium]MBT5943571.1 Hsp20 family protein [Rhodospirillaceae bacterium]MBT6405908.1 Hsp20 family protein [Rhodospirillaceae bacterium]MBT6535846.1 Hsp20 family protein [Rhodospirillaceae bacterium]MBT7361051.1 Hsp20 family protein [Rhodospirillaceae bacterium]
MRTYNLDLTPLFRSSVGFDRVGQMLDSAFNSEAPTYPPYNIEKLADDEYRVTMAVAGFGTGDIDITQTNSSLVVKGEQGKADSEETFLHRGIATRAFERRFDLAEHMNVSKADLVNGLLVIDLKREVPEALKPRKIEIAAGDASHTLDHEKKAA